MTPVDRLSNEELVALRRGDERVLEDVLVQLVPMVRTWVFRFVGPTDAAQDAVQEALIELAAALPRFRGDASVATFARRITLRTASRHVRKLRAQPSPIGNVELELDDLRDPEGQAIARRRLLRLYECLGRLPPNRRSAFILCAVEGLTPREAAEIEGTTSLVMRSRLTRARADIARLMDVPVDAEVK